ncbi:hypothetical protein NND09_07890 [Prevotella copri]|jgi:hypothetical protein|uniref:Lipoprotein n=2 Tax=Segatella copri TaxID=165179 RepID=A0AAW4YKV8_9BACT|nr:hypothetical protein [Segatella copri]MCE4122109.1 hypothetical protein [Segatella copri]MCP9498476.1 hypothetical protein [Segatella copri]MCP9513446.1 hypothetical protein [Segatella copri]MCP9522282.1 hypothetical protein [Segatella copri]MEE1459266.1 hypothetical protein [Segatella copri]
MAVKKSELYSSLCALMLLCTMCLMSCSKDSDGNDIPEIPQEEDRYYVKYEMDIHPWNTQAVWSTTISCQGDKGPVTLKTKDTKWEATYGPIKKNSRLYLKINCDLSFSSRSDSYVRIWVSKNKEPFVLKAEDRGDSPSLQAECGIDF